MALLLLSLALLAALYACAIRPDAVRLETGTTNLWEG